ncbi:universal stress protein [Paraconexibacter sp.]|uniref:universal stress protein n=1 Tax=Paraconexibacter sp. TaxID=2949640 RepID=UPI0035660542
MSDDRTIVVGFDGSPAARRAVTAAVRFAGQGRVVVVHADASAPLRPGFSWRETIDPHRTEHGRATLDSLLLGGNDELADANWDLRLVHGDVASALLEIARVEKADAIAVGTHGHGVLSSLLGSVTSRLVREADRPVIVVPIT